MSNDGLISLQVTSYNSNYIVVQEYLILYSDRIVDAVSKPKIAIDYRIRTTNTMTNIHFGNGALTHFRGTKVTRMYTKFRVK